jgi:formate dehydrogenase iron-sulfur subunit
MGNQSRREFLKSATLLGIAASGSSVKTAQAAPENILSEDRFGVLVDTTVCIGCRKCEWACRSAHHMEAGDLDEYEDRSVFNQYRRPDTKSLTVVNEFSHPELRNQPFNVKVQCMHCDRPACVSACIVGAFSKHASGAVVWDTEKCIGCRYCMVACPYQVPAFEYDQAIGPEVLKCDFCYDRIEQNQAPACVEICPVEAITFGKRSELVDLARKRIAENPEKYIDHIYGLNEVGGSSWMYLASADFKHLKFPQLGTATAPGVSESIQHGIFAYFVPPAALYALLGGIMWMSKNKEAGE